ncbi:DUF6252 family protein [Hymenobacter polaris]|uniref:DUF6252 family protein n=1 Tax=Hymenobacter polaris TaxID=2682546 RepID=UPI0037446063
MQTYRYPDASNNIQSIALASNDVRKTGSYSLSNSQRSLASYTDYKRCRWTTGDSATTYRRGTLTITRLDLKAGIVSGTFNFTLYKPGCDTICVTQGRFDKRL